MQVRSPLFQGSEKLKRIALQAAHRGAQAVSKEVLRCCRREATRWGKAAAAEKRQATSEVLQSLEKVVSGQCAAQGLRALYGVFAKLAVRGPAIAMTCFKRGDAIDGEQVPGPGEAFRKEGGAIGALRQTDFCGSGVCPAVFEAWCELWLQRWPELAATRASESQQVPWGDVKWRIESELTYERFNDALRQAAAGKAAGLNQITVELLLEAPEWLREIYYEGVRACALQKEFPKAWKTIIYVLLAKKHGDQDTVGARRDIALMAQDLKALLRIVKLHVYTRLAGRVDKAQCGFVRGIGAQDVALLASFLLQGGRRARRNTYLLYVDVAKFFPAIDRSNLRFAELMKGVPEEVVELVGALFGEMAGVYDSAHGTCEEFKIYMGALMGCVLSPDRAKLLLDTVVTAIRLHTRGVLPWGSNGVSISQIVYCDDHLGIFEFIDDLNAAWAIWRSWEAASGCKLGVAGKDKTVVAVGRWKNHKMVKGEDPLLKLADGSCVPCIGPDEIYKHVGIPRTADGDGAAARRKIRSLFHVFVERLARLGKMRREEFIKATNAIVRGIGGFYGAAVWGSFEWADGVEAGWRRLFRRRYQVPEHAARLWFYVGVGKGGKAQDGLARVHLHVAMASAMWAAQTKALGDRGDTDVRRAARAETARAAIRWGCVGDIACFDPRWANRALESNLARKGGDDVADAFWFLWGLIGKGKTIEWEQAPPAWDPWHGEAVHTRRVQSACLWLSEEQEGLGLEVERLVLLAGVVEEAQLFAHDARGQPRLLSSEGAQALDRLPAGKAHASAWGRLCVQYSALGRQNPLEVWRGGEHADSGSRAALVKEAAARDMKAARPVRDIMVDMTAVEAFMQRVAVEKKGELSTTAVPAAAVAQGKAREAMDEGRYIELREEAVELLQNAFPAARKAEAREWLHGNPSDAARYGGPHIRAVLPHRDEFSVGTPAGAIGMPALVPGCTPWHTDDEGYVCYALMRMNGLFDLAELEGVHDVRVPCAARAFTAARAMLEEAEAPVFQTAPQRFDGNFIVALTTSWYFDIVLGLEERVGVSAIWSLDGSRRFDKEDGYHRASCAAVRHDGRAEGGRIAAEDSYTTELAAQLEALSLEGERRILICFDASSPIEAWLRWRGLHDRQKVGYYQDRMLSALDVALNRFEAVCFVWIHSHDGVTINEWADAEAAKRLADKVLIPVRCAQKNHASMSFGSRTSAATQATEALQAWVCAKLRAASHETQWKLQSDLPLPALCGADEDELHALLGSRWFPGDKTFGFGELGRRVRGALCPCCGRKVACTWLHALAECEGLREERLSISSAVVQVVMQLDTSMTQHPQANALADVLRTGLFGSLIGGGYATAPDGTWRWASGEERVRWAVPSLGSKAAVELLRGLGMLWDAPDKVKNVREARRACKAAALAVLAWMRKASKLFTPQAEAIIQQFKAQRGVADVWAVWQRRTRAAGPRRLGALREARAAMTIVARAAARSGLCGGPGELALGARVARHWRRRRWEIEAAILTPLQLQLLAAQGDEELRPLQNVGLAAHFVVAAWRWRADAQRTACRDRILREQLWEECKAASRALLRRGDGGDLARVVPTSTTARYEEVRYQHIRAAIEAYTSRRCGVAGWRAALEAFEQTRSDFFEWAQQHGDYVSRATEARLEASGRVREGMAEGRWVSGVWVVAEPEFAAPWCAGCPRCRAHYLRARADRVPRNAEVVLSGARRRDVAARRVQRRRVAAGERGRVARVWQEQEAAVVERRGVAAELVWVQRQRVRWAEDKAFRKWQQGVRPRRCSVRSSRAETRFLFVARWGYDVRELAAWRARRRRKGLGTGGAPSRRQVDEQVSAEAAARYRARKEAEMQARRERASREEARRKSEEEKEHEEVMAVTDVRLGRLLGGSGVSGGMGEEGEARIRERRERLRRRRQIAAVSQAAGVGARTSGGAVWVGGKWVRVGWVAKVLPSWASARGGRGTQLSASAATKARWPSLFVSSAHI